MFLSLYTIAERTFDVRKQTFVFRAVGEETLESSSDHGIFAHQDDGVASQVASDLVHLLRRDIVDADLVKLLVRCGRVNVPSGDAQ